MQHNNYVPNIYIALGIITHLERFNGDRRLFTGYVQRQLCFLQDTQAPAGFGILGGVQSPVTTKPPYGYREMTI
jgi:hypothetical protein